MSFPTLLKIQSRGGKKKMDKIKQINKNKNSRYNKRVYFSTDSILL